MDSSKSKTRSKILSKHLSKDENRTKYKSESLSDYKLEQNKSLSIQNGINRKSSSSSSKKYLKNGSSSKDSSSSSKTNKLNQNKRINNELEEEISFADIEKKIFSCSQEEQNPRRKNENQNELKHINKICKTKTPEVRAANKQRKSINIVTPLKEKKSNLIVQSHNSRKGSTDRHKSVNSKKELNSSAAKTRLPDTNGQQRPSTSVKKTLCNKDGINNRPIVTPLKEKNLDLKVQSHNSKKGSTDRHKSVKSKKELNSSAAKTRLSDTNGHQRPSTSVKKTRSNKDRIKMSKMSRTAEDCTSSHLSQNDSSSDEMDWEDVDELSEILKSGEKNNKGTSQNVQIELEASNLLWGIKRRKKRTEEEMIEDYLRKQVNRSIKEVHENMHKTHLLCLLAYGKYTNSCLASEALLSSAMSVIPKTYFTPKRLDVTHLEKFVSWFCKAFVVSKDGDDEKNMGSSSLSESLIDRFETKTVLNNTELVLMFVSTARSVGMKVRLILNFYPLSWKPSADSLIKPKKPPQESSSYPLAQGAAGSDLNVYDEKAKKPKKLNRKMLSTDSESDVNEGKTTSGSIKANKRKAKQPSSSDDDFEDSSQFRKSHKKRKSDTKSKSTSNESDDKKKHKKDNLREWAEVYLEEEEQWVTVDVTRCKIHCSSEIQGRCPNISYVVAFNPDQSVKDVTRRYVANWLSSKDKIQCDREWWSQSLRPFLGKRDRHDRQEDKDLDDKLKGQPLPNTVSDYKNHPLYALQRHLLKFESIYPPDDTPIGYFKGEPVFQRDSVKTLYCREQWIKEAKTVRVDEEPYKIVKARPKWDKNTCQLVKDRPLELFGEWQVEDYEPPIAKNGKVPRNEYGNVELFKPCMIPKGCIHLPISGMNRVARKLNIDCAPALIGFDFHSGGSHPVIDGCVVCEEFKDILMDAWNQEQFEQTKRNEEKRLKRIYDNWKRLISGITLKDRLKEKYGMSENKNEDVPNADDSVSAKGKKRKIIKQDDLDALPTRSLVTHSIPNLKIDLEASVTNRVRNAQKKKPSRNRGKEQPGVSSTKLSLDKNMHSSDSEAEVSLEQRRENIRNILKWNPGSGDYHKSGLMLSDDSNSDDDSSLQTLSKDLEINSANSTLIRSPNYSGKLTKMKGNINSKSQGKNKNKRSILALSSDSGNESEPLKSPVKHRVLRKRNKKRDISYKESDNSEPDISLDESDTGDKLYTPDNKESSVQNLILSSDSN